LAKKRQGPFSYFNVKIDFDQTSEFYHLTDSAGIDFETAKALLIELWQVTATYYPDGFWGDVSIPGFKRVMRWESNRLFKDLDPVKVIESLIEAGYFFVENEKLGINGWAGQYLKKERDRH